MKRVSDPQISPSGKWVLFTVTDVSLRQNTKTDSLWIVPLDGSAPERRLAGAAGKNNGRFSPDGKCVMFSHMGQIWIAPFDNATGTMGDDHAVTALETEADGAIWAPDSKHFLFTSSVYPECEAKAGMGAAMGAARNEEEVRCNEAKDAEAAKSQVQARVFDHLLYRHWNAFVGPKHSHVFYASIDAGADGKPIAPTDLTPASVVGDHEAPTFSLGGPLGYAISPDGKEVAYSVNLDKVPAESTNNDIFVLQVGAEPGTARKVSTSLGSDDGPQYSPDGRWLAWRSQKRAGFESDKFAFVLMNRADGSIKRPFDSNPDWVDEFAWSPSSRFVMVTGAHEGESPLSGVTSYEHGVGSGIYGTKVVQESGEFSDIHLLNDWGLVAVRMTVSSPSEVIFRASTPSKQDREAGLGPLHQLTHLNDTLLNQLSMQAMEPFWFAGAGATEVQGFLIRPPNFDPAKKYPLKFLIHGGPQGAWGDAWSYRWNPELLAANGYVVVMVNPRGSTGYGQQFVDEVSGDWGGRAYQDLMRGLDYAEQHYPFIDKTRECALGASYGGYMANWVLTHTDRFKCIVTHDGMYNPQSAFGTTEELWFNEWEFRPLAAEAQRAKAGAVKQIPYGNDKQKSGGGGHEVVEPGKPAHPWDFYDKPASEDPFRKWSPMLAIKNAHTPTLVIHGQRDYRLDVSEGFQLFTALQLLGVPSKMLYFPDEGHWVMKPKNSELWYQTVNDWCDRWVGKQEAGRTRADDLRTVDASAGAGK